MRTQVNTTQIKNKSEQLVKTLCKEESQRKEMTNEQQQRRLKMKKLSSVTNGLAAEAP
jgi:hypothetical protein